MCVCVCMPYMCIREHVEAQEYHFPRLFILCFETVSHRCVAPQGGWLGWWASPGDLPISTSHTDIAVSFSGDGYDPQNANFISMIWAYWSLILPSTTLLFLKFVDITRLVFCMFIFNWIPNPLGLNLFQDVTPISFSLRELFGGVLQESLVCFSSHGSLLP